ncbi:MAG TPA: hypothetical protein VK788_07180 [Terriglobales bacterium]|nr:hypothetical protein [Terriglobales bacterium]
MAASLSRSTARSTLYRTARGRVISIVLAAAVFLLGALPPKLFAQGAHTPKTAKGPRALGLLELAPNGKAHLIPITILIDGKYYDASAYKAAPVPMALWSDTVYEGVLTGVSQGLFTVTGALQRKDANEDTEWMAEGTWQSASALKAKAKKKPVPSVPRGLNEDEGPPVLRRSSDKPKSTEPPAEPATPSQTASASSTAPGATTPPPTTAPSTSSSPATPSPQTQAKANTPPADDTPADDKPPEDKDRPTLKRGKSGAISAEQSQNAAVPSPKTPAHPPTPAPTSAAATSGSPSAAQPAIPAASQIQLIPAISDSHSPDLIPYAYNMQPGEEQEFRKKMLAIAADEVRARAGQPASTSGKASLPAHTSPQRAKAIAVQPIFEDVQLHAFDLGNVNEAELVLTANARMPQSPRQKQPANPDLQYMITIVARQDVNGDLHKALANITDTQHLDAIPRLELIDAVDVDGDGRGELLFREVSEAGTAFVIYRVIGDRLYPLFQGTPG